MAGLPGWLMIFAGAAMVAMVTLVPSWIESRKLDWQLHVVRKQSQQLTQQQIAYEQFLVALREKDPVVIERMAFYHLRLKPVNLSLIDQLRQEPMDQQAATAHVWQTLPTIEDLLAQPIFKPSQACPPGVIPDTRLVRVATGPHRFLLLGFGIVCLFFGVLPPSRETLAALAEAESGESGVATLEADEVETDELDVTDETELASAPIEPEQTVAQPAVDDADASSAPIALATAIAVQEVTDEQEASQVTDETDTDVVAVIDEASDEVIEAEQVVIAELADAPETAVSSIENTQTAVLEAEPVITSESQTDLSTESQPLSAQVVTSETVGTDEPAYAQALVEGQAVTDEASDEEVVTAELESEDDQNVIVAELETSDDESSAADPSDSNETKEV